MAAEYSESDRTPSLRGNKSPKNIGDNSNENAHSEHLMSAVLLPLRSSRLCFFALTSRLQRFEGRPDWM